MPQIQLYFKFQVLGPKEDEEVDEAKNISLAYNFLHSQFTNITTLIEDKIVDSDNNMYHMRAYVENNFGFNAEAKKTLLRGVGLIKDSDDFDRVDSTTVST